MLSQFSFFFFLRERFLLLASNPMISSLYFPTDWDYRHVLPRPALFQFLKSCSSDSLLDFFFW
jgi:hypothetical protein